MLEKLGNYTVALVFTFINLYHYFYIVSKRLDQLLNSLDDSKIEITSEIKESIKNNIIKFKMDIKFLGKDFESEKDNLLLYSKYNNQVINIRKQFTVSQLFYDIIYYYIDLIQYLFFRMNYKHYFLM